MRVDRGVRSKYRQGGWVGAAISAVSALYSHRQQKKASERQAAQNAALQREFAQQGIQWRVEDAQRAGVHPLYALGSGGAAFSPNPITVNDGGWGEVGQAVGGAIQRNANREEKKQQAALMQAQLEAANAGSAKDYAQAAYWWSEAARSRQASQPGYGSGAIIPGSALESREGFPALGGVEVKYPEQLVPAPGRPHMTGARQPGTEEIQFPDFRFAGAAPIEMDERLGEVGQALLLPYLLGHSVRDELSKYFEQTWPIRSMYGDRILERKDLEDADYARWKKYGSAPRGWKFDREYFNRRR